MLSANPRALDPPTYELPGDPPQRLEAPEYLVQRYLDLTAQRRALEEQLAVIRAELEILAVSSLSEERPRGRFGSALGHVSARLQPTCVFDRGEVARTLQRAGKLADVAVLPGPSLARFLQADPALAARLGDMVRYRKSVILTANPA
jgi:hypothetical protein